MRSFLDVVLIIGAGAILGGGLSLLGVWMGNRQKTPAHLPIRYLWCYLAFWLVGFNGLSCLVDRLRHKPTENHLTLLLLGAALAGGAFLTERVRVKQR